MLKFQISFITPSSLILRALRFILMLSSADHITLRDEIISSVVKSLDINASPIFVAKPKNLRGSSLEKWDVASA